MSRLCRNALVTLVLTSAALSAGATWAANGTDWHLSSFHNRVLYSVNQASSESDAAFCVKRTLTPFLRVTFGMARPGHAVRDYFTLKANECRTQRDMLATGDKLVARLVLDLGKRTPRGKLTLASGTVSVVPVPPPAPKPEQPPSTSQHKKGDCPPGLKEKFGGSCGPSR